MSAMATLRHNCHTDWVSAQLLLNTTSEAKTDFGEFPADLRLPLVKFAESHHPGGWQVDPCIRGLSSVGASARSDLCDMMAGMPGKITERTVECCQFAFGMRITAF
jgi:hypothetical protein